MKGAYFVNDDSKKEILIQFQAIQNIYNWHLANFENSVVHGCFEHFKKCNDLSILDPLFEFSVSYVSFFFAS